MKESKRKIPVKWCIDKLKEALDDYSIQEAKDYLEMLDAWHDREIRDNDGEKTYEVST